MIWTARIQDIEMQLRYSKYLAVPPCWAVGTCRGTRPILFLNLRTKFIIQPINRARHSTLKSSRERSQKTPQNLNWRQFRVDLERRKPSIGLHMGSNQSFGYFPMMRA